MPGTAVVGNGDGVGDGGAVNGLGSGAQGWGNGGCGIQLGLGPEPALPAVPPLLIGPAPSGADPPSAIVALYRTTPLPRALAIKDPHDV